MGHLQYRAVSGNNLGRGVTREGRYPSFPAKGEVLELGPAGCIGVRRLDEEESTSPQRAQCVNSVTASSTVTH